MGGPLQAECEKTGCTIVKLDLLLNRFRLASRDLFNQHYLAAPSSDFGEALRAWKCFEPVEEALVSDACGSARKSIADKIRSSKFGNRRGHAQSDSPPIMINREHGKDHGYWDLPVSRVEKTALMKFVKFFDFDLRRPCDHQYVHVEISDWPSEQRTVGRRALIENQYVSFPVLSCTVVNAVGLQSRHLAQLF